MRVSRYTVGLGLVLVVCVLWTVSSVVVRDVERRGVPPLVVSFVANGLFVVYIPTTRRRPAERRGPWPPWKAGLVLAPLWFGAQLLYNESLATTSVAANTVLSATSALFALGAAAALGVERVTPRKVGGCLVIVAGAALVARGAARDDRSLRGDAAALASAAASGLYTAVLARVVAADGDAARALGFVGLFCLSIFAAPVAVWKSTSGSDRTDKP